MEDHEDVVREYDPVLMRRILSYVKPYRLRFILAIFALLVTTVFDMFIPILIQRTVDRDILPYYYAVQEESLDPSLRVKALAVEGSFHAGGMLFLPGKALTDFSEREKEVLRAANPDFRLPFLAFRVTEENRETIERYNRSEAGTLFFMGDGFAAIREAEKGRITPKDLKIIRGENYRHIRNTAVVYLVILVLSFVFTFIQIYAMALLGQEVMKDLRSELYDHTLRRSLSFLDKNPVGRIVTRITNDVETINELFGEVITSFFKDISLMIGVFVTLFLLSPRLAGYSIVTLPFLGIAAVIFRKKARDAYRRVRIAVSRLNAFLSEHISGMSTVQAFVHEKLSIAQFRLRATELLASNLGEMYVFATFRPIVDIIATVALAIVLYAGAGAFLQGRVSLGVLIAFINLVGKFFDPVRDLAEKYTTLQSAMAGGERVFALLDEQSAIPEAPQPLRLPRVRGEVVFDHVTFSYNGDEEVLRDLSFSVHPSEAVAIVGFTGAGKTTITSLLTRMYDIQAGSIKIDGIDIRDVALDDLRSRVQAVLQDVFLFSGSIADNIRLGSDIPLSKVKEAARLVHADGFIEALPKGYDTILNERGANLSTGQRQLLSFARVLAHDPDIIVLDEATANIDAETEKIIQNALANLLSGRTSLVIAHRLSTIKNADRIIVLHRGRLVEEGKHGELMKKRGMYYNFYRMQYKDTENA